MPGQDVDIYISISSASGEIAYSSEEQHVYKGYSVTWKCESPFAVEFIEEDPLEQTDRRSAPKGTSHEVGAKVRGDARPGKYKYACAVFSEEQVYLDAACPVIIID